MYGYCYNEHEHQQQARDDARYHRRDYEMYDHHTFDPCKEVYTEEFDRETRRIEQRDYERHQEEGRIERQREAALYERRQQEQWQEQQEAEWEQRQAEQDAAIEAEYAAVLIAEENAQSELSPGDVSGTERATT